MNTAPARGKSRFLLRAACLLTGTGIHAPYAQGIPASPDQPRALTLAPSPGGEGGGDAEAQTEALAKAAQNPVANLISFPFQNNFNFGVGPEDVTQYVLNVQPVIPISLNEDWNLITRTIVPIINQPSPAPGIPPASGLGDINPTVFLSPAKSGPVIWGLGPTMTLPTATDSLLGNGLWMAGPAAVALTVQGPWVVGALVNQQWSFAGWGEGEVSAMLIQPFINYNLPGGWYLTSSPILTANWRESAREAWVIPAGGGLGKILHLGKLPLNCQLSAYYNVRTPTHGPDWQLRAQIQFLFPK